MAAQPVLLGEDTGRAEHAPGSQGGDGAVVVETGGPGTEQGVQPPVHAERDRVPHAGGLGNGVGVGEIRSHAPLADAQGGQVQHRRGKHVSVGDP